VLVASKYQLGISAYQRQDGNNACFWIVWLGVNKPAFLALTGGRAADIMKTNIDGFSPKWSIKKPACRASRRKKW
jgi:hypothetical protein